MAPLSKQDLGNSQDLVEIKEVRNGVVVVKDGSFRQIVMVGGVNFSLKSETEQTILIQGYQNFLNSIDFPLQVLIHSRKVNIDAYVASLAARKEAEPVLLIKNQISEYSDFISGFVEKNPIMEKIFLVVVPYYSVGAGVPGMKSIPTKLPSFSFGKKKPAKVDPAAAEKAKEEEDRALDEEMEQIKQRTAQVVNGIVGMGLEATVLNDEQLVELFYNFYNPQTVERKDVRAAAEEH